MNDHTPKGPTVTTAEAAKILGVRGDAVHAMKADGRLTPVGKSSTRGNLYAESDVRALAAKRAAKQTRRAPRVPAQEALPEDSGDCAGCAAWKARALAAEDRERRARAAMQSGIEAALG